jgi:hypothetical protein
MAEVTVPSGLSRTMKRLGWGVMILLTMFGCVRIPFVHPHHDKPEPPQAVQRFSDEAHQLTRATGKPDLPEVTSSMSNAIEALPEVSGGDRLARSVREQAEAMRQRGPNEVDAMARQSLDTALEAVRRAKPTVSQRDKDRVVEVAREAIQNVEPGQEAALAIAYREVARAMVLVTGGSAEVATGSELSHLVTRFALAEPDDARRTGAQALAALADALSRLPLAKEHAGRTPRELLKRAERLAAVPPLDYAEQFKDALSLALRALDHPSASPAERLLLDEAKVAVEAIRTNRPLEMQRANAQESLRLITDALTVRVMAR